MPFRRVDVWAERQPQARWARLTVRDGERGPLRVDAMAVRVRTKLDRRNGPEERLVALRTVEAEPKTHSALSNAGAGVPLENLVRARFARHQVEEVFEAAQQEVGLAHSEVRSWVGWHHPVTLSLVALWLLCCERRRLGGKNPGGDRVAGTGGGYAAVAVPGAEPGANRGGGDAGAVAEGGGADLQVAQGDRYVPAPPSPSGYELNSCLAA